MATVIFVTGASRGFGRALAIEFSRAFSPVENLHLVLLSRSVEELEKTAAAVSSVNQAARVHVRGVDLSEIEKLSSIWDDLLCGLGCGTWARGILVNNAGSPGPIGYLGDSEDCAAPAAVAALRSCFDLDLLSPIILTSLFLKALKTQGAAPSPPSVVVNVSSLAAVVPFASLGAYSISRAARDMLHRVVGEEAGNAVVTLNYAPGPMDSELQSEIRTNPALHGPTRDFFSEMEAKGTWVDVHVSAALCAKLVVTGNFKSGEHLDYYDEIKNA